MRFIPNIEGKMRSHISCYVALTAGVLMLSPLLSFVGYPLALGQEVSPQADQESRNVSNDSTSAPLLKSEEKLPTWYFDLDLHTTPRSNGEFFPMATVGLGLKLELRLSRFASLVAVM